MVLIAWDVIDMDWVRVLKMEASLATTVFMEMDWVRVLKMEASLATTVFVEMA